MKKHLKKYELFYKIGSLILLAILTITFLYLGYQNKQKYQYDDSEIESLLSLKGDTFSRMIQIQLNENGCLDKTVTLTEEQMKTYDFDTKLYKNVSYELKCKDGEQKIYVNMTGIGKFKGHELKNYEAQ